MLTDEKDDLGHLHFTRASVYCSWTLSVNIVHGRGASRADSGSKSEPESRCIGLNQKPSAFLGKDGGIGSIGL
jgi:hypothetical protein